MGKAQSKRSVDITTEAQRGTEDDIIEKMEKIEDLDKKEVNGDATLSEKCDLEKNDTENVENDKDMTTEKDLDVQGVGDSAESETSKDGDGKATTEEISPLADESVKKSKKEKVKKKWSFRSISFGKKDKQKPSKNEDAVEEDSAAINGADTDEKDITDPKDSQKVKSTNGDKIENTETQKNDNATSQELNGEQKNVELQLNDATANTINATTNETCEPVKNETASVSTELSEKTEKTTIPTTNINETKISEDVSSTDALKYGNGTDEHINLTEQKPQKTDAINASIEAPYENTDIVSASVATNNLSSLSTNGEVVDKMHQQNGNHDEQYEYDVVEKTKAQIEVNFNTVNNISAAEILDSSSSTSINPSNVQIHVQDFNTSSEKPNIKSQIHNDESSSFQKSFTDFEVIKTIEQPSFSKNAVSYTEVVENNINIEVTGNITPEAIITEKFVEDKFGGEPSPPPLPISPPPSQVSVFAFINNAESVKDSFPTDISKSTEIKLVKEKEEISLSEQPNSQFFDNECIDVEHSEKTNSNDPAVTHADKVNGIKCVRVSEDKNASIYNDINDVPSMGSFVESENVKESLVAAAVINEVTEKAAEIVAQQMDCNVENQEIIKKKPSQKNEEMQEENKCDIYENIDKNTIVIEFDKKGNIDQQYDDNKFDECEPTSSFKELHPFVNEQINNITFECSLNSSTSNKMEISLNKKKEENLNPTKEFATVKDIKDNVTVAEITKDLSVTCE